MQIVELELTARAPYHSSTTSLEPDDSMLSEVDGVVDAQVAPFDVPGILVVQDFLVLVRIRSGEQILGQLLCNEAAVPAVPGLVPLLQFVGDSDNRADRSNALTSLYCFAALVVFRLRRHEDFPL
ncbi:hypothetical protein Y013_24645 (plasmid) [Rhodococcus pyridinivorans SB3094]|uniref:Uncharacterized protein n=1 Tax=Rhodococcus pyridinivorans SB3094 TaxID=1435356 RepID=V9XQE2_9NOCA|nr:hypothetical protein Y013_24645 [Rhodococcus pyridinivorans SB3094]